jgi:uncharacterized beta-barrel protein YwiB (DUF1934 family)
MARLSKSDARSDRPTTGVFLAWDDEDVTVERRGAGTVHDRTVVTGRRTITRYALYTSKITAQTIEAAERYVRDHGHDNMRVQVFDGKNGNRRS